MEPLIAWTQSLFGGEPIVYGPKPERSSDGRQRSGGAKFQASKSHPEVLRRYEVNATHPAGAPPLDWWKALDESCNFAEIVTASGRDFIGIRHDRS